MQARNFLVHVTAAACYGYALYYDMHHVNIPDREKYGGRWKYLTLWNANMQFVFTLFSIINDLFGSEAVTKKHRTKIQTIRDYFFNALAFPSSMFVAVTFWTLYFIDRELIFPAAIDALYPVWLNHAMHTSVLIWLLIDLLICNHLQCCNKKSLLMCGAFCSAYLLVINMIWYKFDYWVYPVLAVLSWPLKIAFMVVCYFSFIFFYFMCNSIRAAVSKEQSDERKKKK